MAKTILLIFVGILFIFIFNPPLFIFGQQISPEEIIQSYDELMRGESCQGDFTMIITTASWQRKLELTVFTKGKEKTLIRINSPAKEKGITTLRIKNEMWNYLPAVEKTIKIPPSMMLQPWMGSDFSNDDLVKENSIVDDYYHQIIEETKIDGYDVYVIKSIPKPTAGVTWDKRIFWIRKDGYIPIREEFYAKNNKLIKVLEYSQVKKISDRIIPTRWEMVSKIKNDHRTIIIVNDNVKYNEPINDNIFSLQSLKSNKL